VTAWRNSENGIKYIFITFIVFNLTEARHSGAAPSHGAGRCAHDRPRPLSTRCFVAASVAGLVESGSGYVAEYRVLNARTCKATCAQAFATWYSVFYPKQLIFFSSFSSSFLLSIL